MKPIVFFDFEVNKDNKIIDIGAISHNGEVFHDKSLDLFDKYIKKYKYLCGHNIFNHDLKYFSKRSDKQIFIDTLQLSPLLFPKKPYHHLVKDDQLYKDELNNPVSDSMNARDLFYSEIDAFNKLSEDMKIIFYNLLSDQQEFAGFFDYVGYKRKHRNIKKVIQKRYKNLICENADLDYYIYQYPTALAYALTLIIHIKDSITPPWVNIQYPQVEVVIKALRNTKCNIGCEYCDEKLDEVKALKEFFNYPSFRLIDGRPLQQQAVQDAMQGRSLLAVFPTGGGKSLTFQLPALIAGRNEGGLTVVISPLQSLMKDQIDGLEAKEILSGATINGLLNPVERQKEIQKVEDGTAHILYISPEMLRSSSIEYLLKRRNIVRFVIDEAHCFSSWGHDFRVDYQYIGDFIRNLQNNKLNKKRIPVSCFTATAKPQVIDDIKNYFFEKLGEKLVERIGSHGRDNLTYHVEESKEEANKITRLREILRKSEGPAIIYCATTARTEKLSNQLNQDGFSSTFFHGKMDVNDKADNQNKFMSGEVNIMVATTAFGMGVDKDNVKTVIHFDISSSLENYIQEAGRAGRDPILDADCYILFNEDDLNVHFNQLNQSKLSINEIKQIWMAIKRLSENRKHISQSALEIAREAGWDEEIRDLETKVKTAINELDRAGYIKRGLNNPSVFASSLHVKSVIEAREIIEQSPRFKDNVETAVRIVQRMISTKHTRSAEDASAKVDYIADELGLQKDTVINIINLLKEEGILENNKDINAYIKVGESERRPKGVLNKLVELEQFLYSNISVDPSIIYFKDIVEHFVDTNLNININDINRLINYLIENKWLVKESIGRKHVYKLSWSKDIDLVKKEREKQITLAHDIIDYLYLRSKSIKPKEGKTEVKIDFSFKDIQNHYQSSLLQEEVSFQEIETALYYLIKQNIIRIEGAFFVFYNAMKIERLVHDTRIQYKVEDYEQLKKFYQTRVEQIHIVGEYAKKMIKDYEDALSFVNDYFEMDYTAFLNKHFKDRKADISETQTRRVIEQIFNNVSTNQFNIIRDNESKHIVVAAGPGSGKTRLLVHKLASLALLEDVKLEQILMLSFSRAAAIEFKTRLIELIGAKAHYIQISTFHSYAFELLEITGDLEKSKDVVKTAVERIRSGQVSQSRITKSILVIDEAQDMSEEDFSLVQVLMEKNDYMKVIAVGDDDQNIYEFRESNSKYLQSLITDYGAKKYELFDNYRSRSNIVTLSNRLIVRAKGRMKTRPNKAVNKQLGEIHITNYNTNELAEPVAIDISNKQLKGSIGVFTRTNNQALNVHSVLTKMNIKAKLLQTAFDYHLMNLLELRTFVSYFGQKTNVITNEDWQLALTKLKRDFAKSSMLEGSLKLLTDFEKTNKVLYYSDLIQFLWESKEEDFYNKELNEIVVSTLHQSKGKEFDHVFLLYDLPGRLSDEVLRTIYVGMTRAKHNLYIHSTNEIFQSIDAANVKKSVDSNDYTEPNEFTIGLTHRDVQLGRFSKIQKYIYSLTCGDEVDVDDQKIYKGKFNIAYFSNAFKEEIENHAKRGYKTVNARINHLLYWKKQDENQEVLIALPIIVFKKQIEKEFGNENR